MSAPFETMDFAREEVAKCMACGNCQEVCPIYLETHKEGTVARGKIKLVDALLRLGCGASVEKFFGSLSFKKGTVPYSFLVSLGLPLFNCVFLALPRQTPQAVFGFGTLLG